MISSATPRATRRDREPQGGLTGVLDPEHPRAPGPQVVLEPSHGGDVDRDLAQLLEHPLDHADLLERGAGRVGVRPGEPARPEHHAAEPATHHRDHVGQLAAAQHLEDGRAASAWRLSVVARLLDGSLGPDDEGVAVVAGVPVLLAHLVDDTAGPHLVGHPGDGAEEAGLLDLDLGRPRRDAP